MTALLAALAGPAALGGDEALRLTADQYLAHIQYLADDERGGRQPGQPGIEQAAEYIAAQFRAAGLAPGGEDGTYFQTFVVESIRELREDVARVEVSGLDRTWKLHEDFRPFPFSASGAVEGPLAFAGYGIDAEEHGYSDYADFDAAGKVLLILRHEPKGSDPGAAFGGATPSSHSLFVRKARVAHEHGARALLVVNSPTRDGPDELYAFHAAEARGAYALPMVHVTQALADALLERAGLPPLKELAERIDAGGKPASQDLAGLVASVNPGVEPVTTRNVIGVLPGRTDERVVVGAHYDHVGVSRVAGGGEPQIHNGADDNASGTAGIIELARVLAAGPTPRRGLIFIAFSAEESGLLGSKHWVANPTAPLERVRAMTNFDMIGRLSQDKLEIWGVPTAVEFADMVRRAAEPLKLKYETPQATTGIFTRSDHYNFYKEKIPVVFPFTGLHEQYHRPGDDWELVDAEGGVRVLEFARALLTDLANMEHGPTFVDPKQAEDGEQAAADGRRAHRAARSMPRVRLGIVPAQAEDGAGLAVDAVAPGGPADRAGIRKGDRIVRIGDRAVGGISGYMDAVRGYEPDDEATVEVMRDGVARTFRVKFAAPPARE